MRRRSSLVIALIVGIGACARAHADPSVGQTTVSSGEATATGTDASDTTDTTGSPAVGGNTNDTSAKPEASAAPEPQPQPQPPGSVVLYSFGVQAPILNAAEWPAKDPEKSEDRAGVVRLGYLRRGERAYAKPDKITKANCAEGWYELVGMTGATGSGTRAFVCGKFVTTDAHHKELKFAPHLPYMDKNLPYAYGLNLTPGTPLYRRIPLKSERRDNEKTLALGKGVKSSDIAKKLEQSGEALPAYLKDVNAKGNAKSTVRFDDLKGDSDLVAQRMLKGFYLSLDKKIDGRSGVFWHTVSGLLAPKDHLIVHDPKTEFDGVPLDESHKLPLAFVVSTKAKSCEMEGTDPPQAKCEGKVERFSILSLTGKKQRMRGDERVYHETTKGFWVRSIDTAVVELPPVASGIGPGERWIDVDLSSQGLVAFEGDRPVYATIVSTGRRSTDPEKDHRTVIGSFRIREKHVSTTMDDDGASDGTYRIEDVPWVMYFEKSLALHGAFWHSGFGRERSHGCVNLTPHDARHLFGWVGPSLPEGWHGVKATKQNPGTRVIVHK